jgi:hypothetical protein
VSILLSQLKNACAFIDAGEVHGTGYLVSSELVVTCDHIVRRVTNDQVVEVRFEGIKRKARVLTRDERSDCATLQLMAPLYGVEPLQLGVYDLNRGDTWDAYGFPSITKGTGHFLTGDIQDPLGKDPSGNNAIVLYSREIAAAEGASAQGFSGTPVLVAGYVIGHLKKIIPSDSIDRVPPRALMGTLYACPSRFIANLLPKSINIKLLREDSIIPVRRGSIPANVLLSFTKESIQEQIKSVGQDKYIPDLYVIRDAEKKISRFTHFEDLFRDRGATILKDLESIRARYVLGDEAAAAISQANLALESMEGETLQEAAAELKRTFYFREVEEAIEAANSVIMEKSDGSFETRVNELVWQWRGKPFVHQKRLSHAAADISHERFRSSRARALETSLTYRKFLQLFPSHERDPEIYLANDLLKELSRLIEVSLKRCLVLVDKAGTGKTNVTCRVAEQLAEEHPVVLMSGQMELSSEYDIESHIQRRFESAFGGSFTDWVNRVSPGLQSARKWLFIIVDGINENSKRPLLIQLLKGLLPRLEKRRIKIILTCRDLFWDVFRDTIEPHLFEDVVALHEFSEAEWHQVIKKYFDRFNVECSLSKEAQYALRNPLLLRFFCEANRDRQLGRVNNLRLLSVFDLYVRRIGKSISERHSFLKPDSILNLLLNIARKMWEQRVVSLNPDSAEVRDRETSENASVYNLVLSENIILEEKTHTYSSRKSTRFLYDEFMEFMIARSWVDEISDSADKRDTTSKLLQEAVESLVGFPPALGAVLFLDKMLDGNGHLVSEFIVRASKLSTPFLNSQQTSLVYAFESVDFADADDDLIAAVEKFEPIVREDLRERLASIILKILEAHPDHQYARKYVHVVLEVDRKAALDSDKHAGIKMRTGELKAKPEAEKVPRLPPSRYHYSEDTKINAIGILVQMKDNNEYDVIEEGIRKLGRTDLHSALQALEYLDLGQDAIVYKTVMNYMEASQPEYRIYCAWLLRQRYGKEPANFLAQLLTDQETRVNQYASDLFERRLIERELIEQILRRLEPAGSELKTWHLSRFVKLLGKVAQFHPQGLVEAYGSRIVATLMGLLSCQQASLRLDLYRTIIEYRSFINFEELKEKMQKDSDVYVRSLGNKLMQRA